MRTPILWCLLPNWNRFELLLLLSVVVLSLNLFLFVENAKYFSNLRYEQRHKKTNERKKETKEERSARRSIATQEAEEEVDGWNHSYYELCVMEAN
jgi:hypothetical protein